MRRYLVVLAASAGVWAQSVYAIRNAAIHPASGPAIANGTIVIRNGLIEAVGTGVAVPADAWVVEGAGFHVYPGLIDALSKWGLPAADAPAATGGRRGGSEGSEPNVQYLDDGGPEERPQTTSWVKAADLIQPGERSIASARNAGFTTAIVFPSAGIFAGQGSVVNLAGERAGEMVVASPVGQHVSLATRGFSSFPGSLMGSIAYVRQIYLDAEHYRQAKAMYAQNPRGLQRPAYDRALEGVLESPRVLLPASRKVEIDRMLRFGKELKTPFVLYGGTEAWRSAADLKAAGIPMLINLRWPERDRDADPDSKESLRTLEVREFAPGSPAEMARAGALFAFYASGLERSADVKRAVKQAIDAGLSKDDALRAMTWNVAKIFGLDDRLGSLEAGKIANVLVTDGEWFEDRSKTKYVFVDGKKFEPSPEPEPAKPAARRADR
ncbi:MAG: amidohydrolase family protein [Acidobacteria bacterium]|nr:amidohydrolase family protein [Acidobacteriota bacterium]